MVLLVTQTKVLLGTTMNTAGKAKVTHAARWNASLLFRVPVWNSESLYTLWKEIFSVNGTAKLLNAFVNEFFYVCVLRFSIRCSGRWFPETSLMFSSSGFQRIFSCNFHLNDSTELIAMNRLILRREYSYPVDVQDVYVVSLMKAINYSWFCMSY